MQQMDVTRMPFYMSYPMQNLYLTEMEYEKDMDRMRELYPREVKRILELVEEECDKMEYEGSLMFDEYPDRFMLEQITDRIAQRAQDAELGVEMSQRRDDMPPFGPPVGPRDDLRNLIGVLLNHEMYRRRCRHRRCNRWW
ncbi:MAG: hypothetical protein IJZ23_02975 [Roseburia sp.]|nr:hypothetical protein [Roseburia sp.]